MSSIIQLNCNNGACDFEVRLSKNIPVWKEDTPKELRKVPVMKINEQYVLEKISSQLCLSCNQVVSVEEATYICPNCATANSFLVESVKCPKCHIGTVEENKEMKTRF